MKPLSSSAAGQPVVLMEQIHKSYGPVEVLKGVDFTLHPGRARALVGENGAGKSTLLKIIAGRDDEWSGTYQLRAKDVRFANVRAAQRAGIALIQQETISLPTLTVAENVLAGRIPRKGPFIDRRALHQQAEAALERLGISLDLHRPASSLNTAELQLVDIARALLNDPSVLLLDEPTASLPAEARDRLFGVVRRLLDDQKSIVFISHHLNEVFDLCDDVTVLRDGKVVADLSTRQSTPSEIAELMIGRELMEVDSQGAPGPRSANIVFSATGLVDGSALRGVDLEVHEGEILGVTGLLGAGQTELIAGILGERSTQGEMTYSGKPWKPKSVHQAISSGIAILTEDRKSDGLLLEEPITVNLGLASTFRKPWSVYRKRAEKRVADTLIDALQIKPATADIQVKSLSGGNQQKVALGKWLREPHKLIILHEPTRGVDIAAKALLHEQVRALAAQGASVLLVSSDLPEVVALSHRAVVLYRGRVSGVFENDSMNQQALLLAASNPTESHTNGGGLHEPSNAPH